MTIMRRRAPDHSKPLIRPQAYLDTWREVERAGLNLEQTKTELVLARHGKIGEPIGRTEIARWPLATVTAEQVRAALLATKAPTLPVEADEPPAMPIGLDVTSEEMEL